MGDDPPIETRTLFLSALARTPEDRKAYLETACRERPELLVHVERLLERYEGRPGRRSGRPELMDTGGWLGPGDEAGPYRVCEVLGEGGMGVVYLAQQETPIRRRVALKVVKPGMDTKAVLQRFEVERQALAALNHPNIASVLDADSTRDGLPYFAMEFIPGISITRYCDDLRLTTAERLDLFRSVCDAVEHAHRHGIVHRDIKPSNVLITAEDNTPTTKLIDFGLAKALAAPLVDRTLSTMPGQVLGTPAYMSPEQASLGAAPVDHRTDIYSLGVLLYELLAGAPPFEPEESGGGLDELRRVIREEEPAKPSTRISTMGARSTAIAERRRTKPHSLSRALRGDLDWITLKALEKDPNRRYASAAALREDIDRYLSGRPVAAGPPSVAYRVRKFSLRHKVGLVVGAVLAAAVLVAALAQLRSYMVQRRAAAETAQRLLYEGRLAALSHPHDALQKFDQALAVRPHFPDAQLERALLLVRERRRPEALTAAEAILNEDPNNGAAHLLMARLLAPDDPEGANRHRDTAQALVRDDKYLRALCMGPEDARRAIELLDNVLDEHGGHFDARWARARRYADIHDYEGMYKDARFLTEFSPQSALAWNLLGIALAFQHRWDEASAAYGRAVALRPDYPLTYVNRADLRLVRGDVEGATADCQRAVDLEPELTEAYVCRGRTHLRARRFDRALRDAMHVLRVDPHDGHAYKLIANVHHARGAWDEALAAYDEAARWSPTFWPIYTDRGQLLHGLRRYEEALAAYTSALELNPQSTETLNARALADHNLGELDLAVADLSRAIELDPTYFHAFHNRARIYRQLDRLDEALADHDRAMQLRPGPDALAGRCVTYRYVGDDAAALADVERLVAGAPSLTALFYLWIWEIRSLRGDPGDAEAASAALALAEQHIRSADERTIVDYCCGRPADMQLPPDAQASCERSYYYGVRHLIDGDREAARQWFRRSVETSFVDTPEYHLAVLHLRRLEAS